MFIGINWQICILYAILMSLKALKIFKKKLISMQADIVVNLNWKLMLNMKFGVHSKSSCLKVAFLTWKIQLKMLWKHDQTIHDLKLYKITLSMKKVFQDAYKSFVIHINWKLNHTKIKIVPSVKMILSPVTILLPYSNFKALCTSEKNLELQSYFYLYYWSKFAF